MSVGVDTNGSGGRDVRVSRLPHGEGKVPNGEPLVGR